MKIKDLFTGNKSEISVRVKPAIKNEVFKEEYSKEVVLTFSKDAYWLIDSNHNRTEIEGVTSIENSSLDRITSAQSVTLLIKSSKNMAELKSRLFTSKMPISDSIEIGFGDNIVEILDKRFSRQINKKQKHEWLEDQLIINANDKKILLAMHSADEGGFIVFGKTIKVDIKNKNNKLEIIKIRKNTNLSTSSYIQTDVKIKDISETGKIGSYIATAIAKINPTQSYLNTWEKYQTEEQKKIDNLVKQFGFLTITSINKIGHDKYKLKYKINKSTDNWMNIEEDSFIELLSDRKYNDSIYSDKNKKSLKAKLLSKDSTSIIVSSDNRDFKLIKDKSMYAILSPIGDINIQKRRNEALLSIKNASTPMPQLSGILEGIENIGSIQKYKIPALSKEVKKLFGKDGPNEMQELALDKALNTPDIAIIQGPPGTGKTKVISALSQRISELFKKEGRSPEKEILLTSFQHDAVDNMVLKTEVFGLPTIKVTKKTNTIDIVNKWKNKKIEDIDAIQSSITPNEYEFLYENIKQEYLKYIEQLNHSNAKKYLQGFMTQQISTIPKEIAIDINSLFLESKTVDAVIQNKMESVIRNIRTDKISYSDDGDINLHLFLKNYKRYKNDIPLLLDDDIIFIQNILEEETSSDEVLIKLDEIKLSFLDTLLSSSNVESVGLRNTKIENIFKQLIDFYSQEIKSKGSIYTVLTEYQQNLATNENKLKDTIEQYTALLASTVQGSASSAMYHTKSDPFDTIIVDEAALSNPLDLLIPLTKVKRRIVLVGDHRQLPHMIDEDIQLKLEVADNLSEEYKNHLKDTLFERFKTILENLEKKDGIRRVITLNKQYRMHPFLGDFISRVFYEKYGDSKIELGTKSELLEHNISEYKGKVAVSVNIPNNKGPEKKENGSTFRPIEAQEIVMRAKDILDNDPSLSIGIITFYSRQRTEIFKEALNLGMVSQSNEDGYKITKKYEKTPDEEERLRIGTVDSFQGKEFDVVLLSLVRSNNIEISDKNKIRQKYGFLTSYNRLNVAMSRAKKLLIIVGDEQMFTNIKSKENIYGLYSFYDELIYNEKYGKLGCSIAKGKSWN